MLSIAQSRVPTLLTLRVSLFFSQSCVGKCSQNKDCVQCLVFNSGQLSADECKTRCADYKINEVDELTPGQ